MSEQIQMTEARLQSECVKWFRLQWPAYAHCFFKIDNEGLRSPKRASIALAMGLVAGIPDMLMAVPKNGSHGMFVEFKRPGQRVTQRQADIIGQLITNGYHVAVIDTLDRFQEAVVQYFGEVP